MDALDCLLHRCSVKRTVDPAPSAEHLALILAAACQVPDHGLLRPWRFITVTGDARSDLGKIFAEALAARDPECASTKLEREAGKLLRAPLVIVVVCHPTAGSAVPLSEQTMSAAGAAQNIVTAAYALGYGAMWRTGSQAYDPMVQAALGLEAGESIIGFVYVGTPETELPRRVPVDHRPLVTEWAGPVVRH